MLVLFFFFKQKTAYEMRISDWSSDVCSSDLEVEAVARSLMSLFEQYDKTNRKLPPELLQTLSGIDEPGRLADTIAAHLGVRLADKQRLLDTIDKIGRASCRERVCPYV